MRPLGTMKSVHTNTQAVGSIPPKGGGAYASYLSHKEVDCHDHRAEDFPEGKVTKRKKSNRHSDMLPLYRTVKKLSVWREPYYAQKQKDTPRREMRDC